MLRLVFFLSSLFLIHSVSATECYVCDSFQGYCDFDGAKCVGPKCARRTAPTTSGLIREQRLCVPSDSPVGCRKTVLWDEIEGTECVCEGHMCNSVSPGSLYFASITLGFFYIFILT